MKPLRVLVACEFSGIVREAFAKRGHDAWSCDLLDTEIPGNHYKGDIFDFLEHESGFNLLIAHPPCTFLSSSGLHWNCRTRGRASETWKAIRFVEMLWELPIERIAIENPRGCLSTFSKLMRPAQTIQPYNFGEDASKATCLWLKNLPLLEKTKYIKPRIVNGKPRWSNQTDSGQNKLPPSKKRSQDRARTYKGIADAFAEQWGGIAA